VAATGAVCLSALEETLTISDYTYLYLIYLSSLTHLYFRFA